MPYANELKDIDGNPLATLFKDLPNLMASMQFETTQSVGIYLFLFPFLFFFFYFTQATVQWFDLGTL